MVGWSVGGWVYVVELVALDGCTVEMYLALGALLGPFTRATFIKSRPTALGRC